MAASDKAVMLGPWGRTYTGAFWKSELPDFHAEHTVIKIGYGAVINYIQVESDESDPGVVDKEARVPLCADEFIKEYTFGFSDPDAKYLSWISLVNNKNKRYGPYGTVTTSNFSFTVTKGKTVGFFGWKEGPISSFGVELASSDNLVLVGPWGLNEGKTWDHYVDALRTNIFITHGAHVDQITVDKDENSGKNKDNIKQHPKRSGDVGDDIQIIRLGPDEYIQECFVYVKSDTKCLSALGLTTNKDMYGTYGTVKDTSVFPLPVAKGKLLGFFGSAFVPINSVGLVFAP